MGLEGYKAPTKVRLAALWTSTMFCYAYGDYFGLYVPGALDGMNKGLMGPLGQATPGVLVGVALMMAIPSLMVILSLVLPPLICRWTNILLGIAYTGIMAMTLRGSQTFYAVLGVIEMALTLSIAIVALRWTRAPDHG